MVFISENVPRYREVILNGAKVAIYSYKTRSFDKQKWLLNETKSLRLKEVFRQSVFIVGDYNMVSVLFVLYARVFGKTCYIASDWNEIQNISVISKARKCITEYFSHGFVQGTPLASPVSKKTKIVAMLYMTSIISFKQNLNINRDIDFVFIGQLIDRKRISYVVRVFNELSTKGYTCHVYGLTGTETAGIKEICNAASFPISTACSWIECQSVLADSSTLFYPSKEDVWGLTITEALNNGCMPMYSESVVSGMYYSNIIPEIMDFKISLQIELDIVQCVKMLNISIQKRRMISNSFVNHENMLVKRSIDSLNRLNHKLC